MTSKPEPGADPTPTQPDKGEDTDRLLDELHEAELAESAGGPAPQPTAPQPNPKQAMAMLQSLFATLVPPKTIELTDALGNTYTARAVLPARAQIKIMQQLQRLWSADVSALTTMSDGGVAGVAEALVNLAADPDILDGLCDAFKAAHPAIVRAARAKATVESKQDHSDDLLDLDDPANLFPVEELVAGLVPFFIRFAARAGDLIRQVAPTTVAAATA
jgi:hypothetical protein